MIQSGRLILQAHKINFKTSSLRKTIIIIFSKKTYFLNFLEISPRNCFRCKRFNQWAWVVSNIKEYIIPTWWIPVLSNITFNKNPQKPDFDLPQTKQPFELSYTMKNFNQLSQSSCQNPNNIQTSNLPSLQLHNGQEFKNTENKILPGGFTQF